MQRAFLLTILALILASSLSAEEMYFTPDSMIAQGNLRTGEVDMGQPAQRAPTSGLPGFAEVPWKSTFTEVKTRLKSLSTAAVATERVEILTEEKNKTILVRRNDVLYRYNFYKTPIEVVRLANHELKQEEYDQTEAQLFHVKVIFSLIPADQIETKIEKSHGGRTKSTVDDKTMEGAQIWELTGGLVFQWVEPYKKMKFSRTVDFLSDDMARQIMKEYKDYFDAKEKWILQNILLY